MWLLESSRGGRYSSPVGLMSQGAADILGETKGQKGQGGPRGEGNAEEEEGEKQEEGEEGERKEEGKGEREKEKGQEEAYSSTFQRAEQQWAKAQCYVVGHVAGRLGGGEEGTAAKPEVRGFRGHTQALGLYPGGNDILKIPFIRPLWPPGEEQTERDNIEAPSPVRRLLQGRR